MENKSLLYQKVSCFPCNILFTVIFILKYEKIGLFLFTNLADLHEEAGKENEQTLANLSPAEEATSKDEVKIEKFLQEQKSKILFDHIINIGRSVWKNLALGCWYRPHCIWSVLATSAKILPYRPPARLIRTK